MSHARVQIIRTKDGRLRVDIEADPRTCDATNERLLAVLELLGAAPKDIGEAPRTPEVPLANQTRDPLKSGGS